MGFASLFAHDFDLALAYSHQAIEVAEAAEATPILAASYVNIGSVHALSAQLDESRQEIDQAIKIGRAVGSVRHLSFALNLAGMLKNWEGQYAEAVPLVSEGVQIAREHNLLFPL